MAVGEATWVRGYVTKDKFIRGRTLAEIEWTLGFHRGRFAQGIEVIRLDELPGPNQFELAGYSMVAEHRLRPAGGLDIGKIKSEAAASWALQGPERLVKVRVRTPHDPGGDPDVQYPPGLGAPQWKLTLQVRGTVVAEVDSYPDGRYRPML